MVQLSDVGRMLRRSKMRMSRHAFPIQLNTGIRVRAGRERQWSSRVGGSPIPGTPLQLRAPTHFTSARHSLPLTLIMHTRVNLIFLLDCSPVAECLALLLTDRPGIAERGPPTLVESDDNDGCYGCRDDRCGDCRKYSHSAWSFARTCRAAHVLMAGHIYRSVRIRLLYKRSRATCDGMSPLVRSCIRWVVLMPPCSR